MNDSEIRDVTDRKIIPICDGCPGSITVCCHLYKLGKDNDIDYLEILQKKNITGTEIWSIYKDKCGSDIHKMIEYLCKH